MRKLFLSLLFVICLFNTTFGAMLNKDNSNDFFRNQPCYRLDNGNPSGEGHIIGDVNTNNPNLTGNNSTGVFSRAGQQSIIKCRICSVTFITALYPDNYIQFAPGIVEIRFKHTDGNYYMLKYDESEAIYKAYSPEEWEARYAELQTIMSNITLK